jgi:hypothetical protein
MFENARRRNRLGQLVTKASAQIAKQSSSQQRCLWQCSLYRARFSLLRASNSFIRCADRNATLLLPDIKISECSRRATFKASSAAK